MKVVLKTDVKAQGKKGDIINVSDGYASNYLFKNGLAEPASAGAVKNAETQKAAEKHRKEEELKAYREMAEKLKTAAVEVKVKCGENGKIFGSINGADIAAALAAAGYPAVEKRQIVLDEPIKNTGRYMVEARLCAGVTVKMAVNVISDK
ncbi:50S ribosomal protein L9 [Clostridia bacterium]|nr:50S ribosomal protein L9 [Clostridia bacterium]